MLPSLRTIDTQKIVIVFSKAGAGVCATAISLGNASSLAIEVGKTFLSHAQARSLIERLAAAGVSYIFDATCANVSCVSKQSVLVLAGSTTKRSVSAPARTQTPYVSPFISVDFILSTQQIRGPNK